MRRVLFLSYHYPPLGGAGVQRPARLVRYLPQLGYEPVVVTGPEPIDGRWTPTDRDFAEEVPEGVEVHRMAGPEPPVSTGWPARQERWLGRKSPSTRWLEEGMLATGRDAAANVDLVYVWMQPYEAAPAAAELARELGLPLVADLGDPWALDEMLVYPTRLHRRRDLAAMRAFLAAADAIVMSTPEAARRVRETFPELAHKRLLAIPNGFEPADFAGPLPPRPDGPFRIVHTGYLHTELGLRLRRAAPLRRLLGGAVPGVDMLARSHVHLLAAIDRLLDEEPGLRGRLEVHLVGVLSPADRAVVGDRPYVRLHGFRTHAETVELLRAADLLFLPMQGLPPGRRATIVPGKTYEYLAAGRPILAAVPDGDARDLLERADDVVLCRPRDVDAMAGLIREQLERFQQDGPRRLRLPRSLPRYEYRSLAAELAEVFDAVLGRQPAVAALASASGARG